jgi:myosin heavy chain 9/10/11/14
LQIQRREKQNTQLVEDVNKARDKISTLLTTIDELQSSDSQSQLQAKRAEREVREEKEKVLRLERELEGWKGLRLERGSGGWLNRSWTMGELSELAASDMMASRVGSRKGWGMCAPEMPQRKPSNT